MFFWGKWLITLNSKISHNTDPSLLVARVRYATPPIGQMRWQAPQPPIVNRTTIIPATHQPPLCPQSGAAQLPKVYGFNSDLGDEDCLYLNVFAPPNAQDLPVLVWIRKLMPLYIFLPTHPY